MKIMFALLLSSTAAMADDGTASILEWLNRNPVMIGPEWKLSFPSPAPISITNEEKYPVCHKVGPLATCDGGHSVTDVYGFTTFYSADGRSIGGIQMTGAVKP